MKQKNTITPSIVLASISFALSLVLAVCVYFYTNKVNDAQKDSFISNAQLSYSINKLEHCLNNDIKPCNDEAISTWNDSHVEDSFSLKSYQQIIESGIDEFEATKK